MSDLKVKRVGLKNFKGVKEIDLIINGVTTTLIGSNSAGKSTIVQALFLALRRKTELDKKKVNKKVWRAEFIGKYGTSSDIHVTLHDYLKDVDIFIDFRFTKSEDKVAIKTSDGRILDESFLDTILSKFSHCPDDFFNMTPEAQAQELGIDASEIDSEIEHFERNELSPLRIRKKDLKILVDSGAELEKIERVDFIKLSRQKDEVIRFNQEQAENKRMREASTYETGLLIDKKAAKKEEIERLKKEIAEIELDCVAFSNSFNNIPQPQEFKSTFEIDKQITNAQSINSKAEKYEQHQKNCASHEITINAFKTKSEEKKALLEKRKQYIASAMPFSNMTVDEKGGLLVEGKHLNEMNYNYADLWKKAVRIIIKQEPDLKLIYLKNPFNLDRDDDDRIEVLKELEDKGYQFIIEAVGRKKDDALPNCILIRDQRVVNDDEVIEMPELNPNTGKPYEAL